jgi:lysozyme
MRISERGLAHIKHFEGCKLKSYYCVGGKCTIGYGHTGPDVKPGMTITEERAVELLRQDVAEAEKAVAELVKVPLRQGQYDALVDFVFNLGRGALAQSSLLKLLNQREYGKAAEQLMRWVHAGSAVIAGLQRRRQAAREMWLERT